MNTITILDTLCKRVTYSSFDNPRTGEIEYTYFVYSYMARRMNFSKGEYYSNGSTKDIIQPSIRAIPRYGVIKEYCLVDSMNNEKPLEMYM